MDDVVIHVQGMSKSFMIDDPSSRRFHRKKMEFNVFNDVSLDIRRGEVVGVIGKNGVGKSTFLKLVSGIMVPDKGEVEVKGNVASILELSMGFHPDFTGRENIVIRSELYGITRDRILASVDRIVKYADLGAFIDNPVRTYSSGMKSRLAFAVMINVDADIYIIDEALSTGDAAFSAKTTEHLKNLVREGKTVLFTSHSTGVVESTCERAVWLSDKTIMMDGPAEEVCAAYKRSITESFDITKSLAEDGASGAMYRLATFYRDGNGCEADRRLYLEWLQRASEKDHPMAMAEYADILASDGDMAAAREMYRKAAAAGSHQSRRKYALLLTQDTSGIGELREAMLRLASSGFHYDECAYGQILVDTATSEQDYIEAAEWFSKALEHGSIDAAYELGMLYRNGRGVARDIGRFVELMGEASERGHPRAAGEAASLYDDGVFVDTDKAAAFSWYLKGAEAGNAGCMYEVAHRLEEGIGTDADPEQARAWYSRFATASVSRSFMSAADALRGRENDREGSESLIEHSAEARNARAVSKSARRSDPEEYFGKCLARSGPMGAPRARLAECYLKGIGTEKDEKKAFSLYKDAADGMDADSMYIVGQMYKDGTGTEVSFPQYKYYIRMAADRRNKDASALVTKWERRNSKRKNTD